MLLRQMLLRQMLLRQMLLRQMLLRQMLLLGVAAVCLAPAAAVPASSRTLIDPAPATPHPEGCTQHEESCLAEGLLPYAGDGHCYEPLSQGPCEQDGFWFALDRASSAERPLFSGACVRRSCALGEVPHQGRCLATAEARRELCARAKVHLDPEGNPRCGQAPSWRILLARYVSCTAVPTASTETVSATAIIVGGRHCSSTDAGDCTREVVTPSTASSVDLSPED